MQGAPQSPIQSQPQPQPQPQQRRRRPALSCSECRRRKIRCDHTNPCGHCVRHKTQCTYKLYFGTDPNPRPGQQPRPESQQLEGAASSLPTTASPPPSIHRSSPHSPFHNVAQSQAQQAPLPRNTNETRPTIFTENLQVLREPISWPQVTAATATTSAAVPDTVPTLVSLCRSACDLRPQLTGYDPDTGGLSVRDLLQRIQKLEDASKSQTGGSPSLHASSETSRESVALQSPAGVQEWQVVFNKTRDLGKSGWMGTAQEFAVIIACYSEIIGKESEDASLRGPEASEFIVQASAYLRRCKNRALSIKIGRPTRGLSSPGFGLQLPSREVADAMANLYFASFESTYVP